MPSPKPGPHSRRAYAELQGRAVQDVPCGVPTCTEGRVTEDCCYGHALNKPIPGTRENDGVIDQIAIGIAAEGTRPMLLTWVEWEIAAATILAYGHSEAEAARRLGSFPKTSPMRRGRIHAMATHIRAERDLQARADAR